MGDPVSMGVAALGLASTGFKIAGDIGQGNATAAADKQQAQNLEDNAEYGQIKAQQTSTQMQSKLQDVLGNIQAVRASANVSPDSPTSGVLLQKTQALGDQQRDIAVNNIEAQVKANQAGVAYADHAASTALMGGFLGAAGDALSGLSSIASGFAGVPKPSYGGPGPSSFSGGIGIGAA